MGSNKHPDRQNNSLDSTDLTNRIQDLKSRYQDQEDSTPAQPQNQGMGAGFRIATDMVASVLVGVFIGYQLDSLFDTKPIFLLIFIVIGMVAGIVNVVRTANRLDNMKKNQQK